jgi:hypothetical protein
MSDDTPEQQEKENEQEKEQKATEEHVPEGEVIYRAARQDGDYALCLSSMELAWSGLAAGISMGFSLVGEGLLRARLPEAHWAPLVTRFGYALGFLIVILGRQQLFTEQTLSSILPLLSSDRPHGTLPNVARLAWRTSSPARRSASAPSSRGSTRSASTSCASWSPRFSATA